MPFRQGIRGRLLFGFSALLALIIASNFFSDFLFQRFQGHIEGIVEDNLPGVSTTAFVAVKGNDIIDASLALISARDEAEVDASRLQLTRTLQEIKQLIKQNRAGLVSEQASTQLDDILSVLANNLNALDTNGRQRFWFDDRNNELITRLRWAHADFLDEVEPMTGDARFATNHSILRARSAAATDLPGLLEKIQNDNQIQEALLRINATGSLLVELIARSTELSQVDQLADTRLLTLQTREALDPQLARVAALPSALSLIQSVDTIMTFAQGDDTLFDINQDRLQNQEQGQQLLTQNRQLLAQLQAETSRAVAAGNKKIETSANQLLGSIRQARGWLFTAVIIGLLVVFIAVWHYVGRNLVRRLLSLNQSMQHIAAGDLETPVERGAVDDEISDMAESLQSFRDTLRDTQDELVQAGKLAALGQLSAGIAHELNQPLSAIRSYSHNANQLIDQSRFDEASESLQRIDGLVERVADMTNRFKNLARRSDTELGAVIVEQTVAEALVFFQAELTQGGVELVRNSVDESLEVYAEKIRLEQVLINLLQNALDAMQDSEVRQLNISVQQAVGFVSIAVADTGNGLPQAELQKIFDPFYTTKEVGQGLGLGLTISYNIIKDFGGSLKARQNSGGGATFIIKLRTSAN